jgi:hypothetical protein
LGISFLMTGAAILRTGKCAGLEKALAFDPNISRSKWLLVAIVEVIGGSGIGVIRFAICIEPLIRPGLKLSEGIALRGRILRRRCIGIGRSVGGRRSQSGKA